MAKTTPSHSTTDRESTVRPRYAIALLAGLVLGALTIATALVSLNGTSSLPPPPFSNSVCLDEKLLHMRKHPPDPEVNLLIVGSSVAWRHFDSALAVREKPGARPFNGGFCGLKTTESEFVAGWLLSRFPKVRDVIMVLSPLDIESCGGPAAPFDRTDVDRFVFEGASQWGSYLRYFDPVSFVTNAVSIADQRAGLDPLDAFVFTGFGDGPLDTHVSRELLYGSVSKFDPACFSALHRLASRLRDEQRSFMVVTTPLHPDWKAQFDADGKVRALINVEIGKALAGTGASFYDGDRGSNFDAASFTDAIHLRWAAARVFSSQVLDAAPSPLTGQKHL